MSSAGGSSRQGSFPLGVGDSLLVGQAYTTCFGWAVDLRYGGEAAYVEGIFRTVVKQIPHSSFLIDNS